MRPSLFTVVWQHSNQTLQVLERDHHKIIVAVRLAQSKCFVGLLVQVSTPLVEKAKHGNWRPLIIAVEAAEPLHLSESYFSWLCSILRLLSQP
jgi:hypothetical protein